jgi:hypothetical protein
MAVEEVSPNDCRLFGNEAMIALGSTGGVERCAKDIQNTAQ